MSENTEIWNLNALCRCCHKYGYFKSLQDTYIYETEVEVYAKMLRDAFDIEIKQPLLDASNSICEVCIVKLRHAADFKKQVLECEKKFAVYCKNELISNGMEPVKIEADFDMDYDAEYNDEFEIKIKCDNPEDDITKKEEDDLYDTQAVGIKSEVTEDSKSIQIELQPLETKQDAKENGKKKKRVTKRIKTEKTIKKYDPSLEIHVQTDTGTLYSCKICGGSYEDQKSLKKHIQTKCTLELKCTYCDATFTSYKTRVFHVKKEHTGVLKFACSYCERTFNDKYCLKMHENTHTKTEMFKCDICSKEFSYKQSLRTHLKGHYGTKKTFVCHICGNGFNDKTNLGSHIRTVHEKLRPFVCSICPKTFTAKKHLTVHIKKHTGEMPFECEQCQKRFPTLGIFNAHKAVVHNRIKDKYTCKVCRKRFFVKGLFVKHLRTAHIGQRPFKCTICDKDFICKYSMKRHVLSHSGVKPFECELCGVKFAQKGALNRHTDRKHRNLKDDGVVEKCEVCNKNVKHLKKHMLCHLNKRFSCEYCGKSYSENNVLTRHKKVVHFGIKPHVCEFCDKKYVKVNSLKNHQMKVHKIVSKIENDEDFDSAVAKFSIKNKKGKIKVEDGIVDVDEMPSFE